MTSSDSLPAGPSLRPLGLIDVLVTVFSLCRGGSPQFTALSLCHTAPRTPEGSFVPFQVHRTVHGLRPCSRGSAPSLPPCGAFLTTRQDSLHVTVWSLARPLSERYFRQYASDHRFLHDQVLKLRSALVLTPTGLAPAR